MRAVLILCLMLSSCLGLKKLVGSAPEPNYCNIFKTDDDFYLECQDRKTGEFYEVDSLKAQMYLAAHVNQLIEQITWIRQVEAVLEEAEAFQESEALKAVRGYRFKLEGQLHNWMTRRARKTKD